MSYRIELRRTETSAGRFNHQLHVRRDDGAVVAYYLASGGSTSQPFVRAELTVRTQNTGLPPFPRPRLYVRFGAGGQGVYFGNSTVNVSPLTGGVRFNSTSSQIEVETSLGNWVPIND